MLHVFLEGRRVDLAPESTEPVRGVFVPQDVTVNCQVGFLEVPGESCYHCSKRYIPRIKETNFILTQSDYHVDIKCVNILI